MAAAQIGPKISKIFLHFSLYKLLVIDLYSFFCSECFEYNEQ